MKTYRVREVFLTVQGEGTWTGCAAVFVRMAGCNLWSGREQDRERGAGACARWCDTDFSKGDPLTAEEVAKRCASLWKGSGGVRRIVLTGGEPSLQVDDHLVEVLHAAGWWVSIETNGTAEHVAPVDWVTCSPKIGGELRLESCSELKVVLPGHSDPALGWTDQALLAMADRFPGAALWVQPQDPVHAGPAKDQALARCLALVERHPAWRIGLQTHKIMGVS